MALSRRDLLATTVVVLVVLAYGANVHDWWFLGDNRWATVVVFALGYAGCLAGGAARELNMTQRPIAFLSGLGGVALGLSIAAVVTGERGLLLAFVVVLVALWLGSTVRHATTRVPVS